MADGRGVPEAEVRERIVAQLRAEAPAIACIVLEQPQQFSARLASVGLRWDGTAYREIEGSQE